MRSLLALSVVLAAPAMAIAADPEPVTSIAADGSIVGEVVLPRSEGEILAFLEDPARTDRMVDEVLESSVEPDGACTRVSRSVTGLWNPLRYVVRRCRTDHGFTEQLVESTDFARHEAAWEVSGTEAGTRLRYQVRSEPNLSVPRSLVRSRTRSSVDRLLRRIAAVVGR